MRVVDRRRQIIDLVGAAGRVQAQDLATRFEVKAETIRRDLLSLEESGDLQRTHGGAIPISRSLSSRAMSQDGLPNCERSRTRSLPRRPWRSRLSVPSSSKRGRPRLASSVRSHFAAICSS